MKTVPYAPPVLLTDALGDPWPDAVKGAEPYSQREFLLGLTTEQGFAGTRRGIEQIEFTLAVRAAIRETPDGADYQFEDAHHEALAERVRSTEWQQQVAHNFLGFARAVVGK